MSKCVLWDNVNTSIHWTDSPLHERNLIKQIVWLRDAYVRAWTQVLQSTIEICAHTCVNKTSVSHGKMPGVLGTFLTLCNSSSQQACS